VNEVETRLQLKARALRESSVMKEEKERISFQVPSSVNCMQSKTTRMRMKK
jgi:hypothetical protein